MKNFFKIVLLISASVSCTKISDNPQAGFSSGNGVYILNEGNFRGGNGSLSFFSYDSLKIYNNLFYNANGRPLGDVPNSIIAKGDKLYIIVNNSGKIEVIDPVTFLSEATISGLISPRQMAIVSDTKAYVSSIYSDSLAVINLSDNSISGYINLRRSSESIIISENEAYISKWYGGKEIMVVNTTNNRVIDSIQVGIEPESMVLDKDNKIWVLCNGGWTRQNFAELDVINPATHKVENKFVFPSKLASPTCLNIDGMGQTLFYLDNGVRSMDINSSTLPANSLIPEAGSYFYKIGINPANSDIFVTDAVDYTQTGWVYLYRKDGNLVFKLKADIIPSSMCFKVKVSSQSI
jgi:DNA-binding beta-propeller fold protein YncE